MSPPAPSRQPVFAIFSHAINTTVALATAFFVFFVIPRFTAIDRDILGEQPLPALALLVLRLQPLWVVLAFVFILVAIYLAWRYRLDGPPPSASVVLFLLATAQVGLILIALMLPITGTIIREKPPIP